jgi:diguanylate cyclase (GGDEF)-like protein
LPPVGAALCIPLYVEGQLLGMLHVSGAGGGDRVDEALRQRAEIFGAVIKLGLSNLRLRESLRQQAVRDPLTGLPNRRLFDEMLPRELARCLRSGQPVTVAMIDVDRFKHFNDTYGHDAGDRVLRRIAATLTRGIRSADVACRYGGDEFLCLLPGATDSASSAPAVAPWSAMNHGRLPYFMTQAFLSLSEIPGSARSRVRVSARWPRKRGVNFPPFDSYSSAMYSNPWSNDTCPMRISGIRMLVMAASRPCSSSIRADFHISSASDWL